MASERSARTRKAHTDEKVFRAVVDLLRTAGFTAVTVESVAARSGVAKTTIYRRYDDRLALLQATLEHYVPQPAKFEGDDPREVLTALARAMCSTWEDHLGLAGASILAAWEDPAAAIVRDRVFQPRIDQLADRLTGWLAAGRLRPDLDVDLAVSTIIGTIGITYARLGHFPPDWPERFVGHLWPLLGNPAATATRRLR